MNPFFLFLFTLFLYSHCYSQSNLLEGRSIVGKGLWSENSAGVSSLSSVAVGIAIENKFGLSELSKAKLRLGIPNKYGVLVVNWNSLGDEYYNQNDIGLSFARLLSPNFKMGMTARFLQESILNDKHSSLLIDFGVQSQIQKRLSAAAFISNPFRNSIEILKFQLGLHYETSKKVSLALTTQKMESLPANVNLLINYFPIDKLALQTVVSTTSINNSFGIVFLWKHFSVDAFLSYHSYLGFSPQMALTYIIE